MKPASPPAGPALMAAIATLVPLSLCPLWLALLPPGGFWLARGLAAVGGAATLAAMAQGRDAGNRPPLVLVSPAVMLPLLALVFYSLVPAFYVESTFGGPLPIPPGVPARVLHEQFGYYAAYAAASQAEAWVLAFACIGLLLAMAFDRIIPHRTEPDQPSPALGWGLALVCGGGAAFQVAKTLSTLALADVLPPLVMFGMALLSQAPIRRAPWIAAGLVAGAALLFPYHIKSLVFFSVALLLTAFCRSRGWMRIAIAAMLLLSPIAGAGAVMLPRGAIPNLAGKIVYRQSETVFCLDFALRDAAAGGGEWRAGPFYFVSALVPRILWPDKPSLSHGGAFSEFCGVEIPGHSASITLLGEPALRGGAWGMAAAGLVLAGLSAAVIAAWKRGGMIVTALALGLTPWLIDFDQHFAMYVANLAKGLLATLPVALVIGYVTRRQAASRASP
ncbi:putative Membrane protein [Magnetospirillum sp. XM-1]|uniref:hypothetical protein n=1 Tax=Magnetospirillum sp. XM-1 TaxID=1663591 RepID=UPI00073E0D2A|nr:hypothetical protein [Magnetospirillum sp. XM-1]CUW38081.1 putative Membrane protein [Magnetospirillum sp. XM-1]